MVTGVQESKQFCGSYLTKFSIDLNGIGIHLRFVGVINLQSFYLVHSVFMGENPICVISCKKLACIQTFTAQFLANFVW